MGEWPSIPLSIYIVIGPVAWAVLFILMMLGRKRMRRMLDARFAPPVPAPSVTVLVPAKDEAAGIAQCIRQILSQDYPRFRVIAIDDRSTDGTGAILDQLATEHPDKLKVIHIAPGGLPAGWLGKCHALHVGARESTDEWLLFIDSDMTLAPGAISDAVGISAARRYDALSLFTSLQCEGFWDALVLPLVGAAWAVMHAVSFTNDDNRTNIALAIGQFFLIRRSAYKSVGGHETIRDQITEDVEMMRLLKGRSYRTRLLLGGHLASTRMHSTIKQMFHGWGRIYTGSNRRNPSRIIGAILFLLVCGFSVYPALVIGFANLPRPEWLIASVCHLGLITGYLSLVYLWSGNRLRNAWLFPLGGGVLVGILVFALWMCRTGRIVWRDTHFSMPQTVPVHPRGRGNA